VNKKTTFITALIILTFCAAAGAAEYKFTYKKGKIDADQNEIKTGKDSVFAISYGAAVEVRCGPGSRLEINSITKTGESVFTLQQGSCFVRIIDDTSGASVTLNTPFVVLKSAGGAFYADCVLRSASVYGGSARIEFNKRIAKLTQGRTYSDGKITENKAGENAFKDWAIKRDKADIVINLQADKGKQEKTVKILADALSKAYYTGETVFSKEPAPEDIAAAVKISVKTGGLNASGAVSSGITGTIGVIDITKDAEKTADMFDSPVFMPLLYDTAKAIVRSIDQADAEAMKNGRKIIIEAEGLSEADFGVVEKAVQAMPGFISLKQNKYHNIKAVFEVLQAGTGYDIAEVLTEKFKKTNISIWKYSKNIVKLRVVKVKS
jgi:hypothetical protein